MEVLDEICSIMISQKINFYIWKFLMGKIKITLPDGSKKEFDKGVTSHDVAKDIGERLAKAVLAARVNGDLRDAYILLEEDSSLELITSSSEDGLKILRHTAAHVMAQAIVSLWPETKLAIGPTVENGFYYDVDSPHVFTPEDFAEIEKKMKEIIAASLPIRRREMKTEEALEYFKNKKDPYKQELISDLMAKENPEKVSVYRQGDFEDLCRGPHLSNTGLIKAFKITSLAGAYWRGDETRQQLQRIYGTAFFSKKELSEHMKALEEAKKRDHRLLGRTLDLFSFHPESPGNVFFHRGGMVIYNRLVEYIRKILRQQNYDEIMTPQILDVELWKRSGHYDNYREAMYFVDMDGRPSAVKPMNCPGHLLIYKTAKRSYRELPLKFAELGTVHRHEKSGVTHGLMRVRKFTQDDAHIFCTEEQIESEVALLVETIIKMYRDFGFEKIDIRLSTRPDKSIGSDDVWDKAERALTGALEKLKIDFKEAAGDGAFYGPKIDFEVFDALGRAWQLGTIQLDFSMPERFNLEYTGADGEPHRPVMIHRAVYGSLERFIGVLVEHYGGNFPLWLAPVQAKILSVSEKHIDYANKVYENLKDRDVRVQIDIRDQKLGYKIREAELQKCPYMLIVGEKEVSEESVSVRSRVDKTQKPMKLSDFIEKIVKEGKML